MLKIESAFIHLNDIKNSKHTLLRIGCLTSEEAAAVMALAFSGYGIGILPEYALPQSEKTGIHHTRIKESPWIEYGIIRCRTSENPYITKFSEIIKSLDFF